MINTYATNKDRILRNISIDKNTGCWNWNKYKNSKGYGCIGLSGVKHLAHRYSFSVFKEKILGKLCVLHKCDNPSCVNPDHLFLGTVKDNNIDKMLKGRAYTGNHKGEIHNSKLKTKDVLEMKRLRGLGYTYKKLANIFNISINHASDVISGRKWKHLC